MNKSMHELECSERKALSIELKCLMYYFEQAREYADGETNNAALARGGVVNLAKELALLEARFWGAKK